jgi:hypothetical protein
MKHLLNDMSFEERQNIREQHTGGMKVMSDSFSRLVNGKLGDSKPLISEQAVQQVTDLFNELKKVPFYQEPNGLEIRNNRLYYAGNIGGTTKTGMFGKDKSEIGTFVKANDPNARFFEWTGTGWKRGEQQNKYYDVAAVDQNTALKDYANLSLPQQSNQQGPTNNVAITN